MFIKYQVSSIKYQVSSIKTMRQLKIGDTAPEFNATDQDGNKIALNDFKGSKVILYFYPKDNTPDCNAEVCNLRDNYGDLLDRGFKIIGVSADSESSHKKFIEKFDLPFTLIPDTEKEIIKDYGVWGLKKYSKNPSGRSYLFINFDFFEI